MLTVRRNNPFTRLLDVRTATVNEDQKRTVTLVRIERADGTFDTEWHSQYEPIEALAEYYEVPLPRWAYTRPGVPTRKDMP